MNKPWSRDYLRDYVEANRHLVRVKPVVRYPGYYVLKYVNKVFYRNLWTPELQEFRGTVVDKDFNVVMRPFTKIFNYGENGTKIHRDEFVEASVKINGFMGHGTLRHDGEVLVGTTGSMDSEFADLARKWIEPILKKSNFTSGFTYIFEIVDPSDPHIVVENPGAYLIGVRANQWNTQQSFFNNHQLDNIANFMGIMRPQHFNGINFQELKDINRDTQCEGFVVQGLESGTILKLKSPFYKSTKFIGRMRDQKIEKLIDNPDEFAKLLDEEFYGIIDYLRIHKGAFLSLDKQDRIKRVREFFENEMDTMNLYQNFQTTKEG